MKVRPCARRGLAGRTMTTCLSIYEQMLEFLTAVVIVQSSRLPSSLPPNDLDTSPNGRAPLVVCLLFFALTRPSRCAALGSRDCSTRYRAKLRFRRDSVLGRVSAGDRFALRGGAGKVSMLRRGRPASWSPLTPLLVWIYCATTRLDRADCGPDPALLRAWTVNR